MSRSSFLWLVAHPRRTLKGGPTSSNSRSALVLAFWRDELRRHQGAAPARGREHAAKEDTGRVRLLIDVIRDIPAFGR